MTKLIVALACAAALFAVPASATAGAGPGKHGASAGSADPDRDGVDTRNERREGTDPRRRDSDRDGRPDGREDADRDGLANADEDATGNDPIDRDTDDDGFRDGAEGAGVVVSLGQGAMTIRLARGGTVSGVVDQFTDLTCPTEAAYERAHAKPAKALREGGKGKRRAPRKRSGDRATESAAHASGVAGAAVDDAVAAVAQSPEDPADDETGDDEVVDDWSEDEGDWSDDAGEDVEEDDWSAEDEDGGADVPPSACLDLLVRGMRVHASGTHADADGAWFVEVELVR